MTFDIPVWWHACGITLVVTMVLIYRSARSAHILAVCMIRLPGVVLHELAHLVVGVMFRARPAGFSIVPRQGGNGRWTLGSVSFRRITPFNAVPIALAPLFLIPLAYGIYLSWFHWFPPTLENMLLLYAAVFLLVGNALPSRQDLRVACNWKSLLMYGSLAAGVWYVWYCRLWPLS